MRLFGIKQKKNPETLPMISAQDLKHRLDQGEKVLVLDVRQPDAYDEYPGAIPNSVRIPPAEMPDRYQELPRDRLIVPY